MWFEKCLKMWFMDPSGQFLVKERNEYVIYPNDPYYILLYSSIVITVPEMELLKKI